MVTVLVVLEKEEIDDGHECTITWSQLFFSGDLFLNFPFITKMMLCFCRLQTIIFLYLMDNDTSWMILFSSAIGLGIEYWKLAKAFNVACHPAGTVFEGTVSAINESEGIKHESSSVVVRMNTRNKIDRLFGIPLPLTGIYVIEVFCAVSLTSDVKCRGNFPIHILQVKQGNTMRLPRHIFSTS
jgi:hypothetical protein